MRVISTQLIEAGVDVDFPVVHREICGLDSLTQAAGRCNREGSIDVGSVYLFEGEKPPPGMLRQTADCGKELLSEHDDLLSPEAVEAYFRLHYWKESDCWDRQQVLDAVGRQPSRMEFNFRQIAERYRFVREQTESIVVPWEDGKPLIELLDEPYAFLSRDQWRILQRYSVQVRDHELRQLKQVGAVQLKHERWVLTQAHLYDESVGLRVQRADGL